MNWIKLGKFFLIASVFFGVGCLIMVKQNEVLKGDCAEHLNKSVGSVDKDDVSVCQDYWRKHPESIDGYLSDVFGFYLPLFGLIVVGSIILSVLLVRFGVIKQEGGSV